MILLALGISTLLFLAVIFLFLQNYYRSLEKKVDVAFLSQSEDFFKKIDFLFNRMNQHKDLIHQQTLETLNPVTRIIENLKQKLEEMEKSRLLRDSSISNQMNSLSRHNDDLIKMTQQLSQQTSKMINAFKNPSIRGQWGEVQLKKLVEFCGMVPHCEFSTQKTIGSNRPDMVINLPNSGVMYVDSKNPMEAYLKYLEDDDLPKFKKENLKAIKGHISNLSNKAYWKSAEEEEAFSPEMVIMFIPLEILWLSAQEEDSEILEYSMKRNVVVATPMTLLGLLKTIHLGWSQLKVSRNAEKLKQTLLAMNEAVGILGKVVDEVYSSQQENIKKTTKLMEMINKITTIVPKE